MCIRDRLLPKEQSKRMAYHSATLDHASIAQGVLLQVQHQKPTTINSPETLKLVKAVAKMSVSSQLFNVETM